MTYPEVSEIRTEWTPEQVAPTESERRAHEVQQQRLEWWRQSWQRHEAGPAQTLDRKPAPRPIPTVCPKR